MVKKIIKIFLLVTLFLGHQAKAVCPVCTVAVGAGLGLSRWLGIDDTISGLWIGGLTVSLILWTINFFNKKKFAFKGYKIIITFTYYTFIIIPLKINEIIGHPLNTFWGIDKLIFGIIVGSVSFYLGSIAYDKYKEKRGKALFPFQKVVMPILPLIIFSIIFYYFIK